MFCNNCGHENEDGSKFCSFCGQSFMDDEADPIVGQAQPAGGTPEPRVDEKWSVNAGIGGNSYSYSKSNRDPVREQMFKKGTLISVLVMVGALAAIIVIFITQKKPDDHSQEIQQNVVTEAAAEVTTQAAATEVVTEAVTQAAVQEVVTQAAVEPIVQETTQEAQTAGAPDIQK